MRKLLFTSTAALLMSGSLGSADDPASRGGDRHMQAIGAHAGLPVADVGYVPPEVVSAQRLATERRIQQLGAAHSVADVGYVPPESRTQPQERRGTAYGPVADVGYVPPEVLAAWRLSALREEQRLAQRLTALRQARRSFYAPVSDVGYVPPEAVAAQAHMNAPAQETSVASPMIVPAAARHALEIAE
jgi:hypothetical protein